MAIMNLNMGNLILEVNTLKKKLLWGRRRRKCYRRNWIRKEISEGDKHNVEIWEKNRAEVEEKNKIFIKKLQNENEKLKGNTTQLKSQDENLQNLKQKVEI
jgi:hypothetical protein